MGFFLPELLRLRGECLLRLEAPDLAAAVLEFESAIATSRRQNAHAFQLRAATSLARAWAAAGSPEKGVAPLHQALDAFEAGDDAPELATARHLLSELAL